MDLLPILKKHTKYSLRSIQILFDEFSGDEFAKTVNGFPIWQQFYHMVNSMDRIFTDPEDYVFPPFHREQMHMLDTPSADVLSKEVLQGYFERVRETIGTYLGEIDERCLYEKSNHQIVDMTKLDHILGQFRHMAWHIGYLHSCAKVEHGRTPAHILVE